MSKTEQECRDREFTAAVQRTTADVVRKLRSKIQFLEFRVLNEPAILADKENFSGAGDSPRTAQVESTVLSSGSSSLAKKRQPR